ncbi:MAG: hypothetical protein HQL90_15630, partial [Magnetococcales bacterium]|nr:hypothetical protein [Magnetococcales bacterium]
MSGRLIGAIETSVFSFTGSDGVEYTSPDGKWKYRVFTNSGNFMVNSGGKKTAEYFSIVPPGVRTESSNVTVEAILIGGGASGGNVGGGGGAGGFRKLTITLAPGTYPVVIGAGGAAQSSSGVSGNPGVDTTFAGFAAAGGGYGAGGSGVSGGNGGSGGGTYSTLSTAGLGNVPNVTPVQGYNGGSANYANMGCAGGGASQAGGTPYHDGSYAVGG